MSKITKLILVMPLLWLSLSAAAAGKWICPMDCQPAVTEAGDCQVCGMHLVEDKNAETKVKTKVAGQWVCPMNCQPPSDKAGDCSVCGMKLAKQEQKQAHWVCPMDCQEPQSEPGRCGVCGMYLKHDKTGQSSKDVIKQHQKHSHQ